MTLQPDQILSHYRIVEKIGEGGMGEVYRAQDTSLGREVAIKVLPAAVADHPQSLARFEREAKAIAALSHPNILAIHEFGAVDGTAFVVTELLEGETLRSRLRHGALAPHKAVDLGRQAARGLAAAHDRGIIHRDLKPENLFLTRDGRIKILDFGLATAESQAPQEGLTETPTRTSLTSPGTVLGTVGYMSPEQVRGEAVDHRSDIFSFGAILYEMLTGRRAFLRATHAETMTAILREEPEDVASSSASHISPALTAIVRRCLEKQPEERFQSASDLAFTLQAQSEPSVPSSATAAVRQATTHPRRSGLPRVAAALLLGAALGTASAMVLLRPQPAAMPSFEPLTMRLGTVREARFTGDGQGVVYSAAWNGAPLQIYISTAGSQAATPLSFPGAELLDLSPDGKLALSMDRRYTIGWEAIGTLAVASQNSAPRPLLENVLAADWGPDGESLAVVHEVDGVVRLEYPAGNVLYQSPGWISRPRVHPDGNRIAFVDHPARGDNLGRLSIVDGNGVVERIDLAGGAGIAWSPDGRELWYVKNSAGLYAGRPGAEPREIYRAPVSLLLQDAAPDGRVLLASMASRREMAGRAPGAGQDLSLSWLNWTVARSLTEDGASVLFEEGNQGSRDGYAMFIRGTDGSIPVQLGDGLPMALSSDGRWVLAMHGYFSDSRRLVLVPTGPGEARTLDTGSLRLRQWGAWLPGPITGDGAAIVFTAQEPEGPVRLYRLSLAAGATPQPVTPADVPLSERGAAVATDGSRVAAVPAGGPAMAFPLDGSTPLPIPGITPGDIPLRYHKDGRHLFVHDSGSSSPARIMRLDLETGERALWRELAPRDQAGVSNVDWVHVSADGEAHVYAYRRITCELMVATGLR